MSKPWTITIFYDTQIDKGKIRATCVYHVTADNVGAAYEKAEVELVHLNPTMGSIIPGTHNMAPGLYSDENN